ncbi:MAG: hypothetical protein AAF690_23240 [Acidobacteriota bacterium]
MRLSERRSRRLVLAPALLLCFSVPALASNDETSGAPSFHRDVLPVLQANCQTCHRAAGLNLGGMIAPMPLTTYAETRPWAKSIARAVKSGEMPPWHASSQFHGVFSNERTLSEAEIETLARWASTGAKAGEAADAPAPTDWPETEWSIGEPDLVVSLAEPYHVTDDLLDLNVNLPAQEIPAGVLDEDRYIVAAEYKPDTTAVHHIIGFAITPPQEEGGQPGRLRLPGIAPGAEPSEFPPGFGIRLPKGSKLMLQMHYHKEPGEGTEVWDRSTVAFRFADEPVREIYVSSVGDPREMYLPANTKDHFISKEEILASDITIMSLLPHMHYRGAYSKYTATLPDGTVRELLEVPRYDFNWQTRYRFKDHLKLPAGTKLEVTMGYDNTAGNPNNPDPTTEVKWGSRTNDEMNLGFFYWAFSDPDKPIEGNRVTPFVRAQPGSADSGR